MKASPAIAKERGLRVGRHGRTDDQKVFWLDGVVFGLLAVDLHLPDPILLGPHSGSLPGLLSHGSFCGSLLLAEVVERREGLRLTHGRPLRLAASPTATVTSQIGGAFSMVAGTGSPDGGNLFAATSQSGTEGQQQLSQTINNLTPGNEYVLSFYKGLGQRSGYSGATSGSWEVTFGSETYTSPTDNNPSGGFTGGELRSTTFTASSASQLMVFVFNGSPLAGFPVGVLDGIVPAEPSPAPVPEIDPASFGSALALVVGALGMLERWARMLLGAAVA